VSRERHPPSSDPSDADATRPFRREDVTDALVKIPDSWDPRASGRPPLQLPPVPPNRRRGPSRAWLVGGVVLTCVVTAAAAMVAWQLTAPATATPSAPATASAPTSSSAPAPSSRPTARLTATATVAPPPPAPGEEVGACFAELLPRDAFTSKAGLDRLCRATDAYRGMLELKTALVRSRGVTDAMREWSKLGWHETAAFALVHAQCCPDAAALTAPARWASCRMDEALAWLGNALDDDGAIAEAVAAYDAAARCITRAGGAPQFGQFGAPYGDPPASLRAIIGRLRAARTRAAPAP
jgi:hypothetical protein